MRGFNDRHNSPSLFASHDEPFNLAGEGMSAELTAEAEARIRALAESEARKAQYQIDFPPVERAMRGERIYPLHDDTNENAI
jgi:hypothetical protein